MFEFAEHDEYTDYSGSDILKLKQHGGWKSSCVVEQYIDDWFHTIMKCSSSILSGSEVSNEINQPFTSQINDNAKIRLPSFVIQTWSNFSILEMSKNNHSNGTWNATRTRCLGLNNLSALILSKTKKCLFSLKVRMIKNCLITNSVVNTTESHDF